jgi:hypothetical protein
MTHLRLRLLLLGLALASLTTACVLIEVHKPGPRPRAPRLVVNVYAKPTSQGAATSGTCTTTGTACTIARALSVVTAGQTVGLMDGVYRGANDMVVLPNAKSGTSGNRITVAAINDGAVFIDGQFANIPLVLSGNSYWTFQGFDAGNGSGSGTLSPCNIYNSNNNIFQRVTCSNDLLAGANYNVHTFTLDSSSDNLIEDVAVFGTGRNNILEYNGSARNILRRVWVRWEGNVEDAAVQGSGTFFCPNPPFQLGYYAAQTSTLENIITVWDAEQLPANRCLNNASFGTITYGAVLIRNIAPDASPHGYRFRGWIMYGYDNPRMPVNTAWFAVGTTSDGSSGGYDMTDMFLDARSQGSTQWGPFSDFVCGTCPRVLIDRITSIRGTKTSNLGGGTYGQYTNVNECTSPGACPNFYTGTSPGTGARNCYMYENGTLNTAKPLWPWPMDARIKAALTRARNAGTGGSALAGVAGPGYADGTVTSEIVSRYGAVPTQCLAGSGPTPNPPAGLNLTDLWRTLWTQIVGMPV